jgi:tetratricopeptide (TPR) repeat protein
MTSLRVEQLTIPGAPLGAENPLPFFRDPQIDLPVKILPSVPAEKHAGFGAQAGFRVLPYRMQDEYGRARRPLTFSAIVLENATLKATFLPELGGRLYSLIHKPLGRELLARNPVFQPANLALRNAWFSGGIEWNIGQFGHTYSTCAPLFAAQIAGPQGEPGLRMYEFERSKRLLWQIDFYLPPDSPLLLAYTRVANPNDQPTSMYWWTNIAVPEAPDVRVLAPTNRALYLDSSFQELGFGAADLPNLPSLPGRDPTYSLNFPFANEFFFQCDEADLPWEAALDGQGTGMFEASTPRMRYRKLFCWGNHQGGQRWQEFLSVPGQAYIEIQGGLAPTQLHSQPMPAGAVWDWTQAFGYVAADPALVHSPDWPAAWQAGDRAIKALVNPARLAELEAQFRARADAPGELLHHGSGWGALEQRRRVRAGAPPLPGAFAFPDSTLGDEQAGWLALLEQGRLPERDPQALPGAWMTQPEWEELLDASQADAAGRHWYALLHAGVMRLERFDAAGAAAAWRESIDRAPSAWAYRNLAQLALRDGQSAEALELYAQAWDLAARAAEPPAALAQEYLQALCAAGEYARALAVHDSLAPAGQARDRIRILRGRIAMGLGDLDAVERALEHEYADIREGENELTDLWFELWGRRLAAQAGRPLDDELRRETERRYPPPLRIDYRMKNG